MARSTLTRCEWAEVAAIRTLLSHSAGLWPSSHPTWAGAYALNSPVSSLWEEPAYWQPWPYSPGVLVLEVLISHWGLGSKTCPSSQILPGNKTNILSSNCQTCVHGYLSDGSRAQTTPFTSSQDGSTNYCGFSVKFALMDEHIKNTSANWESVQFRFFPSNRQYVQKQPFSTFFGIKKANTLKRFSSFLLSKDVKQEHLVTENDKRTFGACNILKKKKKSELDKNSLSACFWWRGEQTVQQRNSRYLRDIVK